MAVPARNEEERLGALIAALDRQTIHAASGPPTPVIVVLNNCTDRSAEAARRAAEHAPAIALSLIEVELPPEQAHAGAARRLAMDAAAAICGPNGVILTTDADATPDPRWIEETSKAIEAGADLVGGRLIGDPIEEAVLGPAVLRRAGAVLRHQELCDELASILDPLPHDPWPRHHDHTGASLAVRADVYRALGGMPPLAFREDLAFVSKARAAGFKLRHAPAVRVVVSARLDGRAAGGMADCLRRWREDEAAGLPLLVENPVAFEERLWRRTSLRALQGLTVDAIRRGFAGLGVSRRDADVHAAIEDVTPDETDAPADTPAAAAIDALAARIATLKGRRDAA